MKSGGLGEGCSSLATTSLLHVVHVISKNVLFGGHTITCSSCYFPALKMLKKMQPTPRGEVCSSVADYRKAVREGFRQLEVI